MTPTLGHIWDSIREAYGISLLLALGGAGLVARDWRRGLLKALPGEELPRLRRGLLLACLFWFVVYTPPLLRTGIQDTVYGYVLALPLALLVGRLLLPARPLLLAPLVLIMVFLQWQTVTHDRNWAWGNDDRRVPAMAAYLNQRHPELLAKNQAALLPRDIAANVGQYARGCNRRIVMYNRYPVSLKASGIGEESWRRDFVESYRDHDLIKADWLILTSEDIAEGNVAVEFYRRLWSDPRIDWLVCLQDQLGRKVWLGQVRAQGGGRPAAQAPVEAIAALVRPLPPALRPLQLSEPKRRLRLSLLMTVVKQAE